MAIIKLLELIKALDYENKKEHSLNTNYISQFDRIGGRRGSYLTNFLSFFTCIKRKIYLEITKMGFFDMFSLIYIFFILGFLKTSESGKQIELPY